MAAKIRNNDELVAGTCRIASERGECLITFPIMAPQILQILEFLNDEWKTMQEADNY